MIYFTKSNFQLIGVARIVCRCLRKRGKETVVAILVCWPPWFQEICSLNQLGDDPMHGLCEGRQGLHVSLGEHREMRNWVVTLTCSCRVGHHGSEDVPKKFEA